MSVTPRDRRDFTEGEYKRELELHHVKLEKGQTASQIYRAQSTKIKDDPKSGVFRDFSEYGVHPAYVVIQRPRITIPFLLSMLTAHQVAAEITHQKARTEKKKPDTSWPEEEAVAKRGIEIVGRSIRSLPTIDEAFELIKTLQERKSFVGWTPPMQQFMSAFNLYLFRIGTLDKIPARFVIPPRERAMAELTPLVDLKIATKEIEQRVLKDPGHWGMTDPDRASIQDRVELVAELMKRSAYTQAMREVVGWYKTAYLRMNIPELVKNILNHQDDALTTVRVFSR